MTEPALDLAFRYAMRARPRVVMPEPKPIQGQVTFPSFTPIASRPRAGRFVLVWSEFPDAPITLDQARALAKAGHLFVASRHHPDRVECVVKSRGVGR